MLQNSEPKKPEALSKYNQNDDSKIQEEMEEDDGEFDCNVSGIMGSASHKDNMSNKDKKDDEAGAQKSPPSKIKRKVINSQMTPNFGQVKSKGKLDYINDDYFKSKT